MRISWRGTEKGINAVALVSSKVSKTEKAGMLLRKKKPPVVYKKKKNIRVKVGKYQLVYEVD
jgi:mRNA-degrading endonuclease RelE of RelBE toxin-antitoxin system